MATKTVTFKLFKFSKKKLSETDYIRCMSNVSVSIRYKLIIRDKFEINWHKLPEFLIKKLNKTDCAKYVNSITALIKCKLIIWNVTYHFKKKCAFNNNVKLLIPLFKKVIVMITVMKKVYEKFTFALMNLIWETQL